MNVRQLLALGALGLGLSSCNLLGNVVSGGPTFSGDVRVATGGTQPAKIAEYRLAVVRANVFGGVNPAELEAAEFASINPVNNGLGSYTGSLPATVDLGNDTVRFYTVIVFDDIKDDNKFDTGQTNGDGSTDKVLATSINGKNDSGNRYLVFAKEDQAYGNKQLKKGWNEVQDVNKDSTQLGTGRDDDIVVQGLGGVDVVY